MNVFNNIQKKRRKFSDSYCKKEIEAVDRLKKAAKEMECAIKNSEINLAAAEAIIKCGVPLGSPEKIRDEIGALKDKMSEIQKDLAEAQKVLITKREEARKTKEYLNIS